VNNKKQKLELTWIGKENQPRRKSYREASATWLEAGTIILNEIIYNYDNIYP
jgi:hypothetical protein